MNKLRKFVNQITALFLTMTIMVTSMPYITEAEIYAAVTGEQVARVALNYVGIGHRPNKVTDYWGGLQTEWCAMLLALIADEANVTDAYPRVTYVDKSNDPYKVSDGFRDWFERQGRFFYRGSFVPKAGDLIIFENPPFDGIGDHIGIIVDVNTSTNIVTTVEGNVDDCSMMRRHNMSNNNILGYCRPYYNDGGTTTPPAATEPPAVTTPPTTTVPPAVTDPFVPSGKYDLWTVTSYIGCWLRYNYNYGEKIGILSTGTSLYSDKSYLEWVHVLSAPVEGGGKYDGWVHSANIRFISSGNSIPSQPVTTTATTTTSTTTTTTTTTSTTMTSTTTTTTTTTTSTTTTTTTIAPPVTTVPTTAAPPVTQIPSVPNVQGESRICSAIGANFRWAPYFDDSNIIRIIDTDTRLKIAYTQNGFAFVQLVSTGEWGWVHTSTITDTEQGDYSYGCVPTHRVASDIGCNFRTSPDFTEGNIIQILDTDTLVTLLEQINGFGYCEVTLGDGTVLDGYISLSVLEEL